MNLVFPHPGPLPWLQHYSVSPPTEDIAFGYLTFVFSHRESLDAMQSERRFSVLIISVTNTENSSVHKKRHKLILDLFNSKIKESFVVNTILSLNTLLISLDIYYMNKMLTYF